MPRIFLIMEIGSFSINGLLAVLNFALAAGQQQHGGNGCGNQGETDLQPDIGDVEPAVVVVRGQTLPQGFQKAHVDLLQNFRGGDQDASQQQ